jgi:hypothetical protein
MTEQEEFDIWKSRVEMYLVSMVKKSISELKVIYDFDNDFKNRVKPETTASRLIELAYHPKRKAKWMIRG